MPTEYLIPAFATLARIQSILPVDINRALHDDYANEPERRNLQLEARAHIEVQQLIDQGLAPSPCGLHERTSHCLLNTAAPCP